MNTAILWADEQPYIFGINEAYSGQEELAVVLCPLSRSKISPHPELSYMASGMERAVSNSTEKRIAVVTGGNKGIGLGICRQLAINGVKVILTARDEKRGEEAVAKLKDSGLFDVVFHQLEVTNRSSVASLADFIRNEFGRLDILVNNAAISGWIVDYEILEATKVKGYEEGEEDAGDVPNWMKKCTHETYETAEECLKTNFYGTKYLTEALIPFLQLSTSGRIVNVSSTLGQLKMIPNEMLRKELSNVDDLSEERLLEIVKEFLKDFKDDKLVVNGWPTNTAAYKVSKVLINAYTRILARKYTNLRINCVSPGFVKTDMSLNGGILTVEEGAKGPVMLAHVDNKYSGLFFDRTQVSAF